MADTKGCNGKAPSKKERTPLIATIARKAKIISKYGQCVGCASDYKLSYFFDLQLKLGWRFSEAETPRGS